MYLCPACEHRHVPPTGIWCPHLQQPRSTPLKTTARSQRLVSRRARTSSSDENDDYLRCSGRPRHSPRPSTGPGSSSEDDHSQDMFVTRPTTSQGRSARPKEAPTQPAALPPVRSTPPVPPPRSSQFRPSAQPVQPEVATMLLEQMRQTQAQNQREFARLEQQGASDRLALQQAIQAFAGRCDQTPANPATVVTGGQRADTPVTIAGPSHSTAGNGDQRPPESIAIAGPSSSRHAVPDTQTSSSTSRVTPTASLPSVISDTSDPSRSVSPAELQADKQPVKRLRKDQKTSTTADQFLKDIGYISSQGNSTSDISPADGLWPKDYVDRLTGNEPTFDSLKLSEFISGYLTIMEETLPRGVDLSDLRRHFSYLRSLMVDCSEVDGVTARTAHKQVLLGIHYRRFTWLDQRGCIDAKRVAIQRILRIPREAVPKALPVPEVIITPCPLYQSENCQLPAEHTTAAGTANEPEARSTTIQKPAATRRGKQMGGRQKTPNAGRRAPRNRTQTFLDCPT